jgi:hypothetical protein
MEMLQSRAVQQVTKADNLPKAWLYDQQNAMGPEIVRPDVEIDLEFLDDLLEVLKAEELERNRIFNYANPVVYLTDAQRRRKERADAKKALKLAQKAAAAEQAVCH